MKIETPICPECGLPVKGTADTIPAIALLERNEDGSFDYAGESDIYWDGQETTKTPDGRFMLCCENGHEWPSWITEDDEEKST